MPKVQTTKLRDRLNTPNRDGLWLFSDLEAGDRSSRRRVDEGRCLRVQNVERFASQSVEQQLTHQAAVVDVHPLGAGDERSVVAAAPMLCRRKEVVDMQARKAAGLHAPASRRLKEPGLPLRRDLVVPYIRGIAEEERRPVHRGKFQGSVVAKPDCRATAETHHRQVRAQHQGRQWVDV